METGDLLGLDDPQTPPRQQPAAQHPLANNIELFSQDNLLDEPIQQDPFGTNLQQSMDSSLLVAHSIFQSGISLTESLEQSTDARSVDTPKSRRDSSPITPVLIAKSGLREEVKGVDKLPEQLATRLAPLPASIEPQHLVLPTRKWIEHSSFHEVNHVDPLLEVINKAFPGREAANRPQRKLMSVQDALLQPDPYKALMQANSWKAVALLAKNDLIATHPIDVERIMRLWLVRWWALLRLSLVEIIQSEADKLSVFDCGDMLYDKYPSLFPQRTGPMISFELALFINKIPAFRRNYHDSIHRMYQMLYPRPGLPELVWDLDPGQRARVVIQIVNLLLCVEDYENAARLLQSLTSYSHHDPDLWSAVGRINVQMGNSAAAYRTFMDIERSLGIVHSAEEAPKDMIDYPLPDAFERADLVLANRAFLHIARGSFDTASSYLTDLATRYPNDPIAMNNLGVCQLHKGNLAQGANFLENLVIDSPRKAGTWEPLLSNLCLMYDLMERSMEKKKRILKTISKSVGDDFSTECLKI